MNVGLTELAITAILRAWNPQVYHPPFTDVEMWIGSIELLCEQYGIPDIQRQRCAVVFVKNGLRQALVRVVEEFRVVRWDRFKALLREFDGEYREQWEQFPFWRRHPKYTGAAIIVGGLVLVPVAGYALASAGLTSAGFAAGSAAITYESILYASAARVLAVQALQAAGGAATVMPTIGAVLTGASTTGVGVLVASTDASTSGNLLQQAGERVAKRGKSENDNNDSAIPYGGYLLTSLTVLAIVKAWDVGTYDPPRSDCAKWLDEVHDVCERYGIPPKQRASCASHRMRADCKEAVHAAGCYNMTWDEFTAWVRQYDDEERMNSAKVMA